VREGADVNASSRKYEETPLIGAAWEMHHSSTSFPPRKQT